MIKQNHTKILLCITISLLLFFGCSPKSSQKRTSIAIFVPGIVSGSPVYEMLVTGVTDAINRHNEVLQQNGKQNLVELSVFEAGTNQAEWSSKMTALVSSGLHDLIISSNPSLPDLIAPLTAQFPEQKFIILDAFYEGNNSIKTVRYNQREQAWLCGYMAAITTNAQKSEMPFANKHKKIALIAAQEYPVMNNIILPGFIEGAQAFDKDIDVEFRLVGNWYDASKASDIAHSLFSNGVDVILPICGGASQGVIAAAKKLGFYITWFDNNGFAKAPENIISSSVIQQKKLAFELTTEFLSGKLIIAYQNCWYSRRYVDFIQDDPIYIKTVHESIRNLIAQN